MKVLKSPRLAPGRYIVAVSGGVDSMTLLDLLARQPGVELVVAHFDHGIRPDSAEDERLVRRAAKTYQLVFETGHGKLGSKASEDQARKARYSFLQKAKEKHGAQAIITAHHQDDLIETAMVNVLRGSGRKGLSAIMDNPKVIRPLISIPKKEIMAYALAHKLNWREDSTNNDPAYLRNHIRQQIMANLSDEQRRQIVKNIDKVAKNRVELDSLIATLSHSITEKERIDRSKFTALPTELGGELMASWLRQRGISEFDRKTIERLCIGLKTARAGTKLVINKDLELVMAAASAHFSNR